MRRRLQNRPLGNLKPAAISTAVANGLTMPAVGDSDNNRMVLDHEGIWHNCKAEEMRIQGARRVQNLLSFSEDFSQSAWVNSDTTDTDNGDGSFTLTMSSTGTGRDIRQTLTAKITAGQVGRKFIFTVEVKDLTNREGDADDLQILCEEWSSGGTVYENGSNAPIAASVTDEWKRFTVVHTVVDSASTDIRAVVRLNSGTTIQTVKIRKAMLEESTGRASTTVPSEYVSTGVGTGAEFVNSPTWTGYNGGSASGESAQGVTVTEDGVDGTQARVTTPVTLVVGATYVLSGYRNGGSTNGYLAISANADGSSAYANTGDISANTTGKVVFKATTASSYLVAQVRSTAAAANVVYENISLKRIDLGANVDGVKYFTTENGNSVS